MADEKRDNPGVVAPPPSIYFAGLVAGLIFNYFFPAAIAFLPRMAGIIAGIVLIVFAGFVIFAAFRAFSAAKTNIEPWKPTTAIVSSGVYRFSRNPIYLAMTLLYVGAALLLDSVWVLLFVIPVLFLINFGVILREEKYLTAKFGKEYLDYKKRVRRWI
ncbi:MAG: isoprenylcysteine carboxylmethyltransferase family protein [Acidobacteriota bacterium]|nr:isoprenylcysteine carboxylmethyltransferase family protein [Acidobacteriota bacterium]